MTAKTTADVFFQNFIVHYGIPAKIHSDQGANFEGKLIKELRSITGMKKSRTTPYHPSGNGMCERFNRSLLNMLGTLPLNEKNDWKRNVGYLVHAYNSTRHETTGHSPFFLMYDRHPKLSMDLGFGLDSGVCHKSLLSYVSTLREKLKHSYDLARKFIASEQMDQKEQYDRKARAARVAPGDRVLVRVVAFDGKHKIANKWEDADYIVLCQPNPDVPVYVIRRSDGKGVQRTLHRNLLLPIDPIEDPTDYSPEGCRCNRWQLL